MITALEIIFLYTWEQTVLGVLKVVKHPILVLVQVVEEPFLLGFCHIGFWLRYRDHFDSAVTGLRHHLMVDGAPPTVPISNISQFGCRAWLWRLCVKLNSCAGCGELVSVGMCHRSASLSKALLVLPVPRLPLALTALAQRSIIFSLVCDLHLIFCFFLDSF